MKKPLIATALALVLVGCGSPPNSVPSPPSSTASSPTSVAGATAERTVFAAKSAYATALAAAVAYKKLAACSVIVKPPCSDPAILAQIQKADNVTAGALDAAEAAVRTPSVGTTARDTAINAATASLAALNALVATIGASK